MYSYDIFLVDVSSHAQNEQYLSSTFSAKIQQLIGDESIIIYNAGVQPSHDTNHARMSHDWARDNFLVRTSLSYFHQCHVLKCTLQLKHINRKCLLPMKHPDTDPRLYTMRYVNEYNN
jgi:hypothetical protein